MEEKSQVWSSKLMYDEHQGIEVIPPDTVSYQSYVADSHSNNQTRWVVDSPGEGYLLDAFALVRFEFTISSTAAETLKGAFTRIGAVELPAANIHAATQLFNEGKGTGSTSRRKIALRQNFPVCRAIQTATLGINGYQIVEQPYLTVDALNRLKMSKWDSMDYATMSAGYFDDGDHSFSCKELQAKGPMLVRFGGQSAAIGAGGGAVVVGAVINSTTKISIPGEAPMYGEVPPGYEDNVVGANAHADAALTQAQHDDGGVGGGVGKNKYSSPQYNFLVDDDNSNKGFGRRLSKMASEVIAQGGSANLNLAAGLDAPGRSVADRVTIVVYEPVPVSPFAFYPSEGLNKTIPHVNRLTLQYNYVSNRMESICQGLQDAIVAEVPALGGGTGAATFTFDFATVYPQLRLRWYRPPVTLPPVIPLNLRRYRYYQMQAPQRNAVAMAGAQTAVDGKSYAGVETGTMDFTNIRLDGIPDMFLIYFKYDPNQAVFTDPSDHNLAISSMQIELDGQTSVINANSADLYKIWLSNSPDGCKSSYDEWFKRHCVVALKPDDLGMQMPLKKPATLNLRNIRYYDFWCHPRTGYDEPSIERGQHRFVNRNNYILYVVAVYEQRQLVLSPQGAQEKL